MNWNNREFFSVEKLSYWYMTVCFSVVSVVGNSVTVTVIRQSKRVRRLVNFFLCMLTVNNLVLTSGNLAFVAMQAFFEHRALFANNTTFNATFSNESFNNQSVDTYSWKARFTSSLRVHFITACGGCQLWILLTIVMAPKLVMKTRITWPVKLPTLTLAGPCLPYVFCSILAATESWMPCKESSSLQPVAILRTCCRFAVVTLLWVFPVVVYLMTSFRREENVPVGSGRSRFSSTLSALHRLSLRIHFPRMPHSTPRRNRYETWTAETFRVITLAKTITALLWLPFFGSLALTAFRPCSDVTMDYVTWSYSVLLCSSSFPVMLFACSGKFRDGCKRLCNGDKQDPNSRKTSDHRNRNQRKYSAPVMGRQLPMPLQPRGATMESCFNTQRRTQSEDISSKHGSHGTCVTHCARSVSLGGSQSHIPLNWKKIRPRVAPQPLAPEAVETSIKVEQRSQNTLEVPDRGPTKLSPIYSLFTVSSKILPLRKRSIKEYMSDPGVELDKMEGAEATQSIRDDGFNFMNDERL